MYRTGCWLMILLAACAGAAWGQRSGPQIGYAYPAGGQQGTTFRAVVGGQLLRGADQVHVSGGGVRVSVIEYIRPLNNNELRDVGWFIREIVRRRWSISTMRYAANADPKPELPDHPWLRNLDEKSFTELIRLRNRLFDYRQQPNAQIGDQLALEVTIERDAAPGLRDLRVSTPGGVTNPVRFEVGTLPEVREEQVGEPYLTPVALPVVLNGQIMPGEVDHFLLRAKQGQQLVIRMQARRLVPYLADAVPGWFQGAMSLLDAGGHEVAYNDDYRFDPDPVIFYKVPADGIYRLKVSDSIFRGRDDFVYRIAAGELPFVTQAFPLGARLGAAAEMAIDGYNLPVKTLKLDTAMGGPAVRTAAVGDAQGLRNELCYAVTALPEALETEPNDTQPQAVTAPVVINGRIGQPGDADIFSFTGKSGHEVVVEVLARRLGSPLDGIVQVLDEAGQVIAVNDDHPDPAWGLVTHQADPYVRVKLPADGTYRVCLRDSQQQGSAAHGYRLQIGTLEPDFAMRVTPSGVSLGPGRTATLTFHALRKGGFEVEVQVAPVALPEGFTATECKIPADKMTAETRLTAPRNPPRKPFTVQFEGLARIGEVEVRRPVAPAENMMQAFAYMHLVPQQDFVVAVPGARGLPAVWRPLAEGFSLPAAEPLRLAPGATATVQVRLPQTPPAAPQDLRCTLPRPPRGITVRDTAVTANGLTFSVKADAVIASAGDRGHLVVEIVVAREGEPPVSLGVLPAIAYEIVRD